MEIESEAFRPIRGYEGFYEISSTGKVWSVPRVASSGRFVRGRFLKVQQSRLGYLRVTLCKDGGSKIFLVHRLVAEAFIGPPPEIDSQVNHIDGNKENNTPENLEWCTAKENIDHAIETGLREAFPSSVLEKTGERIRELWKDENYRERILSKRESKIQTNKASTAALRTINRNKSSIEDLPGEEWKPLSEFDGMYMVSNFGRVKSVDRIVPHVLHGTWHIRERILKQSKDRRGDPQVALHEGGGKMKTLRVARCVAENFLPRPDGCEYVTHINGDVTDNKISNLMWITSQECRQRGKTREEK